MDQISILQASQSLRKERWIFFDIWKLERKKNEEIKGRISRKSWVLFHIIQQIIHNICTKLQKPRCNSSWEIFDTQKKIPYMYYMEWEIGKTRQNKSQQFCFLSHIILGHSQCVYKIWRLALIEAVKFVTENLLGEKEKKMDKGNDKQQHADSLLHDTCTMSYTHDLYQISKSQMQQFLRNLHKFPYVLHWSERWKKGKMEKEGKINHRLTASWFSFPQYTWPISRCI